MCIHGGSINIPALRPRGWRNYRVFPLTQGTVTKSSFPKSRLVVTSVDPPGLVEGHWENGLSEVSKRRLDRRWGRRIAGRGPGRTGRNWRLCRKRIVSRSVMSVFTDVISRWCFERMNTSCVSRVRHTCFGTRSNRFREDSVITIYASPTVDGEFERSAIYWIRANAREIFCSRRYFAILTNRFVNSYFKITVVELLFFSE